jgi:glycerophosphoryl diester phosphodiesterase
MGEFLKQLNQNKMAEAPIYFNSLRGKKGQYSTKLSINVAEFVKELEQHTNEKGYVNLEIKEKKAADKYGNNVYAVLDTWKPNSSAPTQQRVAVQSAPQVAETVSQDDLPF